MPWCAWKQWYLRPWYSSYTKLHVPYHITKKISYSRQCCTATHRRRPGKVTSGDASFRAHSSCSPTLSIYTRTQFMFPDTFNSHTRTVHVPRHFQSAHAHSSCSPTPSVHTRTQFMFSDTFNPHTHTVHVSWHFRSTHAHSSCSPTPSVHTRIQFMFPDTLSPHTHTVHVPRLPQSTHAHCSCSPTPSVHTRTQFMFPDTLSPHTHTQFMFPDTLSPHTHTVHVPRHPQSTHVHPVITCIPLTPLCRPLLVDHCTENSACNCTNFAALHSRSSRLPKSFPAPNGVSTVRNDASGCRVQADTRIRTDAWGCRVS